MIRIDKEEHGFYILEPSEQEDPKQLLDLELVHFIPSVNTIVSDHIGNNNIAGNKSATENLDATFMWHKRLGHAPLRVLKKIGSLHNAQLKEHFFKACPVA